MFPAYAGMDRITRMSPLGHRSVPRLRGDGPAREGQPSFAMPCSPPTRGWTGVSVLLLVLLPVFPAYAGMDRSGLYSSHIISSVPRLRGDGPIGLLPLVPETLCSPPTRGWTDAGESANRSGPVFPAYAGMDRCYRDGLALSACVPRLPGDGPS